MGTGRSEATLRSWAWHTWIRRASTSLPSGKTSCPAGMRAAFRHRWPPNLPTPRPGGFAGNLLRVDLTRRTCRAEPWAPETMRELLGGVGLGAMILYRETATKGGKGNVTWDHSDNRLVLEIGRAHV